MMILVVKLLGVFPLFTVELPGHYIEEDDEDPATVGGGSAHNFERDFYPLSPTSHHEWEWADKKGFGFG